MKKLFFIVLLAGTLYRCKSKQSVAASEEYSVGQKELDLAQLKWPGTTKEDLEAGRNIYRNQCTQCHSNFPITKFSEKKWRHEIDDMSPKAKLTSEQKEKLTRFILSYREANEIKK